jgi:hypothetical protein
MNLHITVDTYVACFTIGIAQLQCDIQFLFAEELFFWQTK